MVTSCTHTVVVVVTRIWFLLIVHILLRVDLISHQIILFCPVVAELSFAGSINDSLAVKALFLSTHHNAHASTYAEGCFDVE